MAISRSFVSRMVMTALVAFLSVPAAAQTPSQIPGQAAGQPAPAAPSTTPQFPDEKAAAQQKAKEEKSGRAPDAKAPSSAAGENQQFFEIRVHTDNTDVTPDLRDDQGRPVSSFLTPGNNVTADFTYFQDHMLGTRRLTVLSIVRSNNDPRIDPEQNSLQRGYVRLQTPNWEFNAGDALVAYSRMTFNQNMKGFTLARRLGHGMKVMANAGVFTDRWGSIWKDDLPGKPFTRGVAGVRLEETLSRDKIIGVNFSHGQDWQSSIRPDLNQYGLTPIGNDIGSIDTRMTFHRRLTVDGELAYSSTNFNLGELPGRRKDYGGRLDTNFRVGRFFLRTNYVRLMPSFLSTNARQLADLQDANVRAGYDLTDNVTVEGSYRRTNNNLRHELAEGTTVFQMPEARVTFRRIPGLGRTIIDGGYRVRVQDGPRNLSGEFEGRRETRRVPIPFVDVTLPLGNMMFGVGYERRLNHDDLDPSQNTSANHFSGSLRANFSLAKWNFAPMARYEVEHEQFFRVFGFNTNRSVLASAFVDAPRYFTFDVMYRVIGASLFAECLEQPGGAPCNPGVLSVPGTATLLPAGFRRPAFRAAITYKIRNDESRFLVLSWERNTNLFALPDRDFRERVIALTLVWRLKR